MPTYRGRWKAKVEQEFEIEADDDVEFRHLLDDEMRPLNVVELHDFEHEVDEVEGEYVLNDG